MTNNYQICTRCVMDTSANNISFDDYGYCNYCNTFLSKHLTINQDQDYWNIKRNELHAKIKKNGVGKRYDCIIGVSGGADSSYSLYLAIKNGLRPLAVHLDNGWNSELAQNNIENLVRKLKVDLYTHVIDWEENRDMQLAMIKAGVIDIEMIMDNAQAATTYSQAMKYGLHDILSGVNSRTEGMPIPEGWYHNKFDVRNIRDIQKKFGSVIIKTHPLMNNFEHLYFEFVKKIVYHKYLDYFLYNKKEAVDLLQKELGFVPYPYKHNESIFTRFYQNYILPIKFGVDKRRVHHSNEICTGQMSREDAMKDLSTNTYIDSGLAETDKQYVLKKFGIDESYFLEYMQSQPIPHMNYKSEIPTFMQLIIFLKKIKRLTPF